MKQFLALLETEETAILSGDYIGLQRISEAKAALEKRLDATSMDAATLRQISQMAQRNITLLRAAAAGIDDARKTLERLKIHLKTETYDQTGNRHPISMPHAGLERKL